ncbi:hypothetical protein [Streptomyces sp. AGS-58]|uniref:hypothetical protein n=1 Tax=unclassified Streptomyces TaxID=2593676 RepID=UPI0035A2EA02
MATDAAHAEPGTPLRTVFTAVLRQLADRRREMDGPGGGGDTDAALADLALLVGTVLLSRASDDEDLSRAFLAAARDRLGEGAAPSIGAVPLA